jgi:hypothetical protein
MRAFARAVPLAVILSVAASAGSGPASASVSAGPEHVRVEIGRHALAPDVARAVTFLDRMMDKYATGRTRRLVQSFTGGLLGRQGFTDSETYDDALIIDAYLSAGGPAALSRARVIGDALLYIQAHDPRHDGRIRAAYAPRPLTSPAAIQVTDSTSDVGNMAWVGQALAQLYARTGVRSYLQGAAAIGNWVVAHARDRRGAGGYTGGLTPRGKRFPWKSTEHNIDLYALFRMLAAETGNRAWSSRAAWALRFVKAMWNPTDGRFYVGTTGNGVTPNNSELPEDVNSWSYLALRNPAYAASVTWDVRHLAVTAGRLSGVSFCAGDRSGVWFEGTAHLADALELRNGPGDSARAAAYLADIRYAQARGPGHDGFGIIAASKNWLSDCDGDFYFASLHTGATAWFVLASLHANPFFLIR